MYFKWNILQNIPHTKSETYDKVNVAHFAMGSDNTRVFLLFATVRLVVNPLFSESPSGLVGYFLSGLVSTGRHLVHSYFA